MFFYYKYDQMLEKTGYIENKLRNDINATLYETVFGLQKFKYSKLKVFSLKNLKVF